MTSTAIRTILCPVDFSGPSKAALQVAASLAKDYEAALIVLHVAEPEVIVSGITSQIMCLSDEERQQIINKLEDCLPSRRNFKHEQRLVEGEPVEEILRTARKRQADLIVIGTHGRTGVRRLLMGSVAEQIVRKAPCPVLALKSGVPASAEEQETVVIPAERELAESVKS